MDRGQYLIRVRYRRGSDTRDVQTWEQIFTFDLKVSRRGRLSWRASSQATRSRLAFPGAVSEAPCSVGAF